MDMIYKQYVNLLPLNLRVHDNTNVTTDAGLSAEMKTYYHDTLIDMAEPKLVYDTFGQKVPIPKGKGKVVEFRKFGTLPKALTQLVEGVTPVGRKMNVSVITSELKQFGDYIEYSDVLQMTTIDPIVAQGMKMQGGQAGRTSDTITRDILMAGTNKMFVPSVVNGVETEVLARADVKADSCELSADQVLLGLGRLKRMNAEPAEDGAYVCIIHSDVATDLARSKDWKDWNAYTSPEKRFPGEIGRIGDVRFVQSTEAKIIGPGWIFGNENSGGVCRLTLKTALNASGSTDIVVNETITAAQAKELTDRISGGETVKVYVGGKEATLASATAGAAGSAKLTAKAAVTDVAAGAVVCGYGAGKDGSAIYCSLLVGANAYGVTELSGMGLEYIVKQLGSAGSADPLNQRSTTGWKLTKTAERLVEEYMIRIEHSSRSFGKVAVSN